MHPFVRSAQVVFLALGTLACRCPTDADGDGWTVLDGDCDDNDPSVHPDAEDVCEDDVDQDCDGQDRLCGYTGFFSLESTGVKLVGEETDDYAGGSVASAGDVDGDGFDDILVGAMGESSAHIGAGAAYLVYGPLDADLDLSEADAKLVGEEGYDSGGRVHGVVDANDDGFEDLIIGAQNNERGGDDAGVVYIVYGPVDGRVDLWAADVTLIGEEDYDDAGSCASPAGDVNADGHDDVLVGARYNDEGGTDAGAAYLVYGPLTGDLDLSAADVKFTGVDPGEYAGDSVASAGDVNADGFDEVIIGAVYHRVGLVSPGSAYLIHGPVSSDVNLSEADVTFRGEENNDLAGKTVASAQDVDADGYSDVLISAPLHDEGILDPGAVYLIRGPVNADRDLSEADVTFIGEEKENALGVDLASAGDVDHDGHADVLIGAAWNDAAGSDAGKVYLFFGSDIADGNVSTADAVFIGERAGDYAGYCLSSAGDVDADGYDDLLLGAWGNDDGGSDAGAAYLILLADMP